MLYNNSKLADVNTMSYDDFIIIKLTSEMPLELRQKIFTLELGVDSMTWPLFVEALTNLVAIEKVTKVKRLAPVGNISAKSGGKKSYPQASSIPDLVRKLGCMRCGKAHTVSECTVPKTVICTHCSKPGHQIQACFSKIRSELPPGHSALAVAAKVPALPAPGQISKTETLLSSSSNSCPLVYQRAVDIGRSRGTGINRPCNRGIGVLLAVFLYCQAT